MKHSSAPTSAMYLRRESGSKLRIYPVIFSYSNARACDAGPGIFIFFGSILEIVGFKTSPKGNFENACPSAMLISSLRIKILSQG